MARSGHRVLPHPADVIVQAWAPTPEECITEAVHALVESFADASLARGVGSHDFTVAETSWAERLVAVLEEVVFLLDSRGQVPVAVTVQTDSASFELADVADADLVGSTPKGISRSGLEFSRIGDTWHCCAIVDV